MKINGVDVRQQGDKEWKRMGPLAHLDVDEPVKPYRDEVLHAIPCTF